MNRGSCVKCGNEQIIVSAPSEFGETTEYRMSVTYEPRWLLSAKNPKHGYGRLVLLTCRRCGYSEWWATKPGAIPIGPDYGTRLHGAPERSEAQGRMSLSGDASGRLSDPDD